jgi:sterol desaturase/sphingolipid hydroxylase (fatty acid hydroxylase superfamily)
MTEIYAYAYFGIVLVVALGESLLPQRRPDGTLCVRWFSNIAISILGMVIQRAAFPLTLIGWAALCTERGWGLLPHVDWPVPLGWLLTVVALDFAAYGRHYMFHRVSILWRAHRTHHSDADYDFTTGLRFHPLEVLVTAVVELGVIALIGAPPGAVFLAQIVMMVTTFVEHANIRVPRAADRMLRTIFVTPDMHAIHHSQVGRESRSNLSTVFSWWDRLFGTYLEEPSAGRAGIVFGLREFSASKHATLPWMLAQPFLSDSALDDVLEVPRREEESRVQALR